MGHEARRILGARLASAVYQLALVRREHFSRDMTREYIGTPHALRGSPRQGEQAGALLRRPVTVGVPVAKLANHHDRPVMPTAGVVTTPGGYV